MEGHYKVEPLLLEEPGLLFRSGLTEMGLDLSEHNIDLILQYFEFLLKMNEHINLISRKMDLTAQISNHLLDSLTPLLWTGWTDELVALDLGSGGGLPAIPLSIIFPGWDYTLIESTGKKASFLQQVSDLLSLVNVHILNQYLQPGKNVLGRTFDLITVRAVCDLKKVIPIVAPLLSSGGYLLLFKGPQADFELMKASSVLKKWGIIIHDQLSFSLPLTQAQRSLLLFMKE